MLLKEVDRKEVPKKAKDVLREFLKSDMDCAEAITEGKKPMTVRNRLSAAARREGLPVIVTLRGGHVFLLREEADHA